MNRLVRIELKKLFNKRIIYIYLALVLAFALILTGIQRAINQDLEGAVVYYDVDYENIDEYDLNDPEELELYVMAKSQNDTADLAENYGNKSAEAYYIKNVMEDTISCMNTSKYIDKNEEKYNGCKQEYDEELAFVNNYDGSKYLEQRKNEVEQEIAELKDVVNNGNEKDTDLNNELKYDELELELIEYRIKNNIELDYSDISLELDEYLNSYQTYLTLQSTNDKNLDVYEKSQKKSNERSYQIYKYKFEHGYMLEGNIIEDVDEDEESFNTRTLVTNIFGSNFLTAIFLVLIGGSIVAEEFNKGTIKQLLLKPYSRSKILFSKIIATLITFVFFLLVYAIATAIISGLMLGDFNTLFKPTIIYNYTTKVVSEHSLLFTCLEKFVCILPMLLILFGIALLMQVITTNTSASIVVPIAFLTSSSIINALIVTSKKIWAFLPTMCWNLTEFLHGGEPSFKYSTLGISIGVDIVVIILLYGLSLFIFKRKDIKNQ